MGDKVCKNWSNMSRTITPKVFQATHKIDTVEMNELVETMLDETANDTEAHSADKPNRTARELQLIRYFVGSNDVLCNFWAKGPDHGPTYESNA